MSTKEIHNKIKYQNLVDLMQQQKFEVGLVYYFDPKSQDMREVFFVSKTNDIVIKCTFFRDEFLDGVCLMRLDSEPAKNDEYKNFEDCFCMFSKKSKKLSCILNDKSFELFDYLKRERYLSKFDKNSLVVFPPNYVEDALMTAEPEEFKKKDFMFLKLYDASERMKKVCDFKEDDERRAKLFASIDAVNKHYQFFD